ncbi:MAG: PAS domain-containing protein [Gemmatimonadota bacterium]
MSSVNNPETDDSLQLGQQVFAGDGEMRARCRAHDWGATSLGPISRWPSSLRSVAGLVASSAFPMVLLWGEELVQLYNDGYRDIMGVKHPAGLGQPTRECWPEVWELNAPLYHRVRAGETIRLEDALFPITRHHSVGPDAPGAEPEDAWFTLSYSPVRDEHGDVEGILVTVVETTVQVRARSARELERERLLAESEQARRQVTATLETIGDAFYAVDANFCFTYVNRRAEALWGRSRETLIGRNYWQEFPQAVGSEPYHRHLEVMQSRQPAHFETKSPILDRWIDVSVYPDETGGGLSCYFLDISERKEADAARRDAEERYHALINTIDQGFCTIEVRFDQRDRAVDYRFLEVSPAFERQTGIKDAAGRWMRDIAPDQDAHWFERYGHVASSGESSRFEEHSTPLGRWFSVYAFRIGNPALRRVGLLFHDITDRKRNEMEHDRLLRELTAEQERLRSLIRHMPAPVALHTGAEHRFEMLSDAFLTITNGRDLTGMTPAEAYPEAVGHGILERFDEVLATGQPWTAHERHVRIDRRGVGVEDTWFDIRYEPVRDSAGNVVGVLNFSFDVTDQVRARRQVEEMLSTERAIRAEAERAQRAAEQAADQLTRLHRVSLALASVVTPEALAEAVVREGAPAVGAIGGVVTRLTADQGDFEVLASYGVAPETVARWARFPNRAPSPHAEALASRTALFFSSLVEYEARYPGHGESWKNGGIRSVATLPLVVGGEPFGVLALHFADMQEFAEAQREFLITVASLCASALERARLFDAESEARREAESANRAKAEFLATMSHELRTPLNAIGGYAELLEMGIRGPVTPQQVEDLRRVQASQRHLLSLVNEVLNYARIETGTVRYDVADVPLAAVLALVEPLVAPQLAAKRLVFASHCADPTLTARADAEKTRQALLNLLSNAIKFTDAGGRVTVSCEHIDNARVSIRVEDTGIGIAPEELQRIFEPFVQVNASLTRTAEGTGLGLAISRDLARGMGGELTAESTVGAGSTFTLILPRA